MLQDCERRAIAKLFRHKSEDKRTTPRQEATEWNTFMLSFHRMRLCLYIIFCHTQFESLTVVCILPSNPPIYYSKSDRCGPFCSGSAIKMWGTSKAEEKFYWRDLLGWGNSAAVSLSLTWIKYLWKRICDLLCLSVPIHFTIYCFISRPVMSQCPYAPLLPL